MLVYHRRLARWFKFSLGFFFIYSLGSFVFFDKAVLPKALKLALEPLPFVLYFFGGLAAVAFCLVREWGIAKCLGLVIFNSLALLTVAISQHFTTVFLGLPGHTKAGIEVASVFLLLLGLPAVTGYCLARGMENRQTAGAVIVFLSVLAVLMVTIHFTIGYGELQQILEQRGWFQA